MSTRSHPLCRGGGSGLLQVSATFRNLSRFSAVFSHCFAGGFLGSLRHFLAARPNDQPRVRWGPLLPQRAGRWDCVSAAPTAGMSVGGGMVVAGCRSAVVALALFLELRCLPRSFPTNAAPQLTLPFGP